MARGNNTGIEFFVSCSLRELGRWIQAHNEIEREREKARK